MKFAKNNLDKEAWHVLLKDSYWHFYLGPDTSYTTQ